MNRYLMVLLGLGVCWWLAAAQAASSPAAGAASAVTAKPHPGVEVARTISLVTGVALSPLVGVGAVGAYDYLFTPKERRAELHWYASPLFWVPALLLVGLVALKDTLGAAVAPGLKKPLDVAEVVENKVSGLVAAGAFIPAAMGVYGLFSGEASPAGANLSLSASGLAAIDAGALLQFVLMPFALIAFGLVWVASHALNVLILLSPFPVIDAALKGFRLFLLSLVTGASFVNPYVGVVFALVIILFAYFVGGWAFRLTVCGAVFSWDFFTRRRRRFLPTTNANWMFLARAVDGVPVRTYGRLVRTSEGQLEFHYRPWLVLASRGLALPEGQYVVGRGLFFSEIHLQRAGETDAKAILNLPPRYRSHEVDLGRVYGMPVTDIGLRKGFKAAWRCLKGLFGARRTAVASAGG